MSNLTIALHSGGAPVRSLRRRITVDTEDHDEPNSAPEEANRHLSRDVQELSPNTHSGRRFLSGSSVEDMEEYQNHYAPENGEGDQEMLELDDEIISDNESLPKRRHSDSICSGEDGEMDYALPSQVLHSAHEYRPNLSDFSSTQFSPALNSAPPSGTPPRILDYPHSQRSTQPSQSLSTSHLDDLKFDYLPPSFPPSSSRSVFPSSKQNSTRLEAERPISQSRRFLSVDSDEELPALIHHPSSPELSEDEDIEERENDAFHEYNPFGRGKRGEVDDDWEVGMEEDEGEVPIFDVVDDEGEETLVGDLESESGEAEMERHPIYQLQAISNSPDYDEDATIDARRSIIINSLELMTLSILQQLVDSVLPPLAPRNDSQSHSQSQSQREFEEEGDDSDESIPKSQRPSRKRARKDVGPKFARPCGITVVLAKRGGSSAPTASNTGSSAGTTRKLRVPTTRSSKEPNCGSHELAILLVIIDIVLASLRDNVVVTKRDIFYRNVALFKKQTVVDAIVEDLAATLQIRRSELNVVAAAKGLFAGSIVITGSDGNRLSGGLQGALISPAQSIAGIEMYDVEWILIIEKEAVFRSLCVAEFLDHPTFPKGVIITGKGFPDVATREFVKQLSIDLPHIPILALLDADPYGLQILSTFVHGSAAMRYDSENLAVPSIEWMGVKASEWDRLGVGRESLLTLSGKEKVVAMKMLRNRDWWDEEWRSELMYMIHLGRKAEIQILASLPRLDCRAQKDPDSMLDEVEGDSDEERPFSTCPLLNFVMTKISRRLEE